MYVASPLRLSHGTSHIQLGSVLATYVVHTPGTQAADNATILLGDEGEPQEEGKRNCNGILRARLPAASRPGRCFARGLIP